jgi:mono/diheme cytochrome c family protein
MLAVTAVGLAAVVYHTSATRAVATDARPLPLQNAESGWTIPAGAADEKNPLPVNAAVLAGGQKIFASKCQRCHGPQGLGDGPDGDRARRERMNLSNPARAAAHPDGVVFHKVWNGRSSPRMPAFKEELSREQVWAVVAFVQSLRTKD